jgi:hypothetical protein
MSNATSMGMQAEIVKALVQRVGQHGVTVNVQNIEQMEGLVQTIRKATSLQQSGTSAAGSVQSKQNVLQSVEIMTNTLKLLMGLSKTEPESIMFVESGGIDAVVELILSPQAEEDGSVVEECVTLLANLAAHNNPIISQHMVDGDAIQVLLTNLQKYSAMNAQVAGGCLEILASVCNTLGVREAGLTQGHIAMVEEIMRMYPDDAGVQAAGEDLLETMREVFTEELAAQNIARLQAEMKAVTDMSDIQEIYSAEHEACYYLNKETGETSWDVPADFEAIEGLATVLGTEENRPIERSAPATRDMRAAVGIGRLPHRSRDADRTGTEMGRRRSA